MDFYCVSSVFLANMHELLQLLMLLGNFAIDQWNHGYEIMIKKCIEPIIKPIKLFIRTLRRKIYKYIALILKNVRIHKLDDIVHK